jgi:succinate dehydrogenase / fumarate reductase cytochrome b subunit
MHAFGKPLGLGLFDPHSAASSAAAALSSIVQKIIYSIGVIATCYHLANGLWTQGIRWGLWTSEAAMRRANYLVLAIGIVLTCVGLSAIVGVATIDQEKAREIESRIYEQQKRLTGADLTGADHPANHSSQ